MASSLDEEKVQRAFEGRPDLIGAIKQAAAAPNWIELFNEISSYVAELKAASSSEPASKKRKLDNALSINTASNGKTVANGTNGSSTGAATHDPSEHSLLQIEEISFVIPQRKKFTLDITKSYIRARHPDTSELIPGISYAWKDISYAFCLPVPEKAQKQYNYVFFPKTTYLPSTNNPTATSTLEPLVFTVAATAPKPGTIKGSSASAASAVSDEYKSLFGWAVERAFRENGNSVKVVEADPKHFTSALKEPHRPNEKAVFVKGFRGSKDGYLFFLTTGILWGFKKPMLFLPMGRIGAVSYVNVLQRTFNISVEFFVGEEGKEGVDMGEMEEIEFAMLDQEDFAGIDAFVKRHGLMDKSMIEQRRAKRLGVNVIKGEDGKKVDVGELAKAQAEAEGAEGEEEDSEDEEDYDPGSEGESEGERTSSEDDNSGEEGGEGGGDDYDDYDDDEEEEEEEEDGDGKENESE